MKSKKLLSIIISVMMIVTMLLPATVYADDEGVYVSDGECLLKIMLSISLGSDAV